MDESNSSKPNSTSQLVLPQPQTEQFAILPPELMLIIIQLLSHKDLQTFCLLSKSSRLLALPALLGTLRFSGNVPRKIGNFDQSRGDVKAVIKELVLCDFGYFKTGDYRSILFPFLRSLPNLQNFRLTHCRRLSECDQGFLQLVASLEHCPLEHFTYRGPHVPEGSATAPPHLKSLSVSVHRAHVYDLIQPSFSTLVELEIYSDFAMFDLLQLRPVGETLRRFAYEMYCFDPEILGAIPDVFPHLTALELVVLNPTRDFRWKKSYDDAIAKNTKLQYLAVTANDFTFCDHQWCHWDCKDCEKQRVQATHALAMACTGLNQCTWGNTVGEYCFNVKLSKNSSERNTSVQVESVPVTKRHRPFT